MTSPRRRFIYSFLLTLIVGLFFYFFIDLVPETGPAKLGYDARKNPFLAMEYLLRQHGYNVKSTPSIDTSPREPGLLFINQPSDSLPEFLQKSLVHWIKSGNQLVIVPPIQWEAKARLPDPLMAKLGVHLIQKNPTDDGHGHWRCTAAKKNGDDKPLTEHRDGNLQSTFNSCRTLQPDNDTAIEALYGSTGAHVLIYAMGKGKVIVLSDNKLFENTNIGDYDNASVLLKLLRVPHHQKVWIIYHGHYAGFFELLWQCAWPVVLNLALFTLIWLWWSARRFGPMRPSVTPPRRRLTEHLRACGRYLWYAGQQMALYEVIRRRLRRRIFQVRPQWSHHGEPELMQALAELSGLPATALHSALVDAPSKDLHRFIHDVQIINHLRKAL